MEGDARLRLLDSISWILEGMHRESVTEHNKVLKNGEVVNLVLWLSIATPTWT